MTAFPMETEQNRWDELLDISSFIAPALIPHLMYGRAGGMTVGRNQSGPNKGMLKVSLAPLRGSDYHRWNKLNCGPGRKMYQRVQAISLARWRDRQRPSAYPA